MALLWLDGFDVYGNTDDAAASPVDVMRNKYQQSEERIYVYTGRHAGFAIVSYWSGNTWIQTPSLTSDNTLIIGFSMYCPDPHNAGEIFQLRSPYNFVSQSTGGLSLSINADRSLTVKRGVTTLSSSAAGVIPLADWCYLELKLTCDNSSGSYVVRIDGVDVLSDTGVDTQHSTDAFYDTVRFSGALASTTPLKGMRIDDFWVCDSTGAAPLNNFQGPGTKIATIHPDGDGDSTNWTPSTGNTNYNLVDEPVFVEGDYVETAITNDTDLYTYESPSDIHDVKAVQVVTEALATEPNEWTLETMVKHNPTVDSDGGQMLGSSEWRGLVRIMETNPVTTVNWTEADIAALQIGVRLG
jgi:hypothetical protein